MPEHVQLISSRRHGAAVNMGTERLVRAESSVLGLAARRQVLRWRTAKPVSSTATVLEDLQPKGGRLDNEDYACFEAIQEPGRPQQQLLLCSINLTSSQIISLENKVASSTFALHTLAHAA